MENKRQSTSLVKSAAKRLKVSHVPTSIINYQGKAVREKTTEIKRIHLFDDSRVNFVGIIPKASQVFLAVEVQGTGIILDTSPIVGCKYVKNLGVQECVECLLLLFNDHHQEEKICIGLSRAQYSKFNVDRLSSLIGGEIQMDMMMYSGYPDAPQTQKGEDIEKYILECLKCQQVEIPNDFRVGKVKLKVKAPDSFTPDNLPKVITAANVRALFNTLLSEYTSVNIFDSKSFIVQTDRCHLAPDTIKCREWVEEYSERLKNSFHSMSALKFEKRICFLVPMIWEEEKASSVPNYNGTEFRRKPTEEDLKTCHFWILGGQHTIMAYKLLAKDESVRDDIRDSCKEVESVMFWAPLTPEKKVLLMGLSKALNHAHETKMEESHFLSIARMIRKVYDGLGRPNAKNVQAWEVSLHLLPVSIR